MAFHLIYPDQFPPRRLHHLARLLDSIPCESPHVVIGGEFPRQKSPDNDDPTPAPQIQTACTTLPNLIRISKMATILDSIEFLAFSRKSRIHLQEICWPFVQWRWPAGGRLCVTHRTLRGTRPRFSSSRLLDSGTSGSRIHESWLRHKLHQHHKKQKNDKISIVGWLCHKLHHCSWCGHDPRWNFGNHERTLMD